MAGSNVGRFVWYDLITSDTGSAIAFYDEVVGWKTEPFGSGGYNMWVGRRGPLGGVMKHPGQPHWMAHVAVQDVDASAALVKKLGGSILSAPADIPEIGRFAIVADPQGASLSLFTPKGPPMPLHDQEQHGEFDWNELLTTDQDAAFAFYSELLGWKKIREESMGPMGKYLIYGLGQKELGGMFTKIAEMKDLPTAWTYYVRVDDIEGAGKRAAAQGGKILRGPMQVPGGSRITQLVDAQGAVFALHEPAKPS